MADEVLAAGDRRYDWDNVDLPRRGGWSTRDASDEIAKRGDSGWCYFDQRPSPNGDDNVVLTFYKVK